MTNNTIEIKYTIFPVDEKDSWRKHKIESNISDDEKIDWEISKTLSDELIKKSATLKPEQLLLQYAEMQKRNLQCEIENLDNLSLTLKTKGQAIESVLDSIIDEQDKALKEKWDKIDEKLSTIRDSVKERVEDIKSISKPIDDMCNKVNSFDDYSMNRFFETLQRIIKVQEESPDLLKFITENFSVKKGE